jgi:hypothetical protein
MQVGDLVVSIHDATWKGIVVEEAPAETLIDHGRRVVRVIWFEDGEETYEFCTMLVTLSSA